MKYLCDKQRRLQVIGKAKKRNGIAYVEVSDLDAPTQELRQRTLFVRLLLPATGLDATNVRIDGGERIRTVAVEWAVPASPPPAGENPALVASLGEPETVLVVRTIDRGDFSWYTLHLVAGAGSDEPPLNFDPPLSTVRFSFKVECATDFDCADVVACPPDVAEAPEIDYLAKDYASLRRLLLDRMSLLTPQWRERSPADLGVALVELLAYVGDQLSYRQDAIATEAYLGTARQRVSLRRHARLVDYAVHEGCAARALTQVRVSTAGTPLPAGTALLTRTPGLPDRVVPDGPQFREAVSGGATVFQTTDDAVLYPTHETLHFYTWGDRDCCLPKGATSATLRNAYPNLKAGDVLILAEVTSPTTGLPGDADVTHRWPVRLTRVVVGEDLSGGLFDDPPSNAKVPVTEIGWDVADALPFPLCLSAPDPADQAVTLEVAVAWGNIVVADHGLTLDGEDLGVVTGRYRPSLRLRPITHRVDVRPPKIFAMAQPPGVLTDLSARQFTPAVHDWLAGQGVLFTHGPAVVTGGDGEWSISDGHTLLRIRAQGGMFLGYGRAGPAGAVLAGTARRARPEVVVTGVLGAVTQDWHPQPDLLASPADAPEFVVECEHDGTATLRFGDNINGRGIDAGTAVSARYRTGNGMAGNVGAGALAHVATVDGRILAVTNPVPAGGGVDPETAEEIRRDAPEAFRVQERAVTEADWAEVAQRHPEVQRATATFRWTGSWHTVFLTVDRIGGLDVDAAFEEELRAHLERFRLAGYDLEVDGPRYVALEIGLTVCVAPDHFRDQVRRDLLAVLGSRSLPDGRRGLFHPDNFTFGQAVYLSKVYAAAQSVTGVVSVTANVFGRRGVTDPVPLETGVLPMWRLEIARLAGDPNFPERGTLVLTLGGGR